jgi:general secretion pathway protein K
MRGRRGFALLAALWLVMAIATVALGLSLEAREHRAIGIAASERATARAAAAGGLAVARARLEQALRRPRSAGSGAQMLRASDPWLDADSLLGDTLRFGDVIVWVRADDLGAKVNVNALPEDDLRQFLSFVLRDYGAADALAQAIEDWRDRDDLPRSRGAERKEYLAQDRLDLPSNRPFRDVDELRLVEGMTPELFAQVAPYLTTYGSSRINVNAAPEPVLRMIRGIAEPTVTRILAQRSQGGRVQSVAELMPVIVAGGNGQQKQKWQEEMNKRITLVTTDINLVATVFAPPPTGPVQLWMTIRRQNDRVEVRR